MAPCVLAQSPDLPQLRVPSIISKQRTSLKLSPYRKVVPSSFSTMCPETLQSLSFQQRQQSPDTLSPTPRTSRNFSISSVMHPAVASRASFSPVSRNRCSELSESNIAGSSTISSSIADSSVPVVCASLLSLKTSAAPLRSEKVGELSRSAVGTNDVSTSFTCSPSIAESRSTCKGARLRPWLDESVTGFKCPRPIEQACSPAMYHAQGIHHRTRETFRQQPVKRKGFWDTVMAAPDELSTESSSVAPPRTLSNSELEHRVHSHAEVDSCRKPDAGTITSGIEFSAISQQSSAPVHQTLRLQAGHSDPENFVRLNGAEADSQMNIPCVLCGVRFRKPGHLNMHWRSVHAKHSSTSYPGSYESDGTLTSEEIAARYTASAHGSTERLPLRVSLDVMDHQGAISKLSHAYGCPQCSARFRRGSDRNRHMRMVHERRRPFACDQCPKQFGRKSFLEAHILTVHEKRRPFACHECGAAFGQRSSLTRHARKIHGMPQ